MSEPLSYEELDAMSQVFPGCGILPQAAAEISELRERVADLENTIRTDSKRIVNGQIDNARLREALESIRGQTACESGLGGSNCWHDTHGRHSPNCLWSISEEAADALSEPDAKQSKA